MQHVVIDTNILFRAFINPKGEAGKILQLFLKGQFQVLVNGYLIQEFLRILRYPRIIKKFKIEESDVDTFLEILLEIGKHVATSEIFNQCRDEKDNAIISLALSSHRKPVFLITADKDILVLKDHLKGVIIVTPQEFLKK